MSWRSALEDDSQQSFSCLSGVISSDNTVKKWTVQWSTADRDKEGPLSFVLRNKGLIGKTLLFHIELLKIIPSDHSQHFCFACLDVCMKGRGRIPVIIIVPEVYISERLQNVSLYIYFTHF